MHTASRHNSTAMPCAHGKASLNLQVVLRNIDWNKRINHWCPLRHKVAYFEARPSSCVNVIPSNHYSPATTITPYKRELLTKHWPSGSCKETAVGAQDISVT